MKKYKRGYLYFLGKLGRIGSNPCSSRLSSSPTQFFCWGDSPKIWGDEQSRLKAKTKQGDRKNPDIRRIWGVFGEISPLFPHDFKALGETKTRAAPSFAAILPEFPNSWRYEGGIIFLIWFDSPVFGSFLTRCREGNSSPFLTVGSRPKSY
jgi:hypothetical protein